MTGKTGMTDTLLSLESRVKVFEADSQCPPLSSLSNLLPQSAEYRQSYIIVSLGVGVVVVG